MGYLNSFQTDGKKQPLAFQENSRASFSGKPEGVNSTKGQSARRGSPGISLVAGKSRNLRGAADRTVRQRKDGSSPDFNLSLIPITAGRLGR